MEIIRTDLKLEDIELDSLTPLSQEELGLDSLDYLMLMTSIEKRWGIRLTADDLSPDSMRSIATLAAYIKPKIAASISH